MKSGVALKVLDCYYQTVILLKEFIEHICSTEVSLQQDDDPDHYISLLNMTYIATNEPLDASTKAKFSKVEAICKMYEVIDRAQIRLFEAAKGKPNNVITLGFRSSHLWGEYGRADGTRQGITNYFPNTNLIALKSVGWEMLLSRIGEMAMIYLLAETSVFVPLPNDSYAQIVGQPITSLTPHRSIISLETPCSKPKPTGLGKRGCEEPATSGLSKLRRVDKAGDKKMNNKSASNAIDTKIQRDKWRTAADIPFMRRRIFYARPVIGLGRHNAGRRNIVVGLPPNHVLNRLAPVHPRENGELPSEEIVLAMDVRHVLKHMFPRQFGFESPFTIQLDQQAGGPVFPDYTNRDDEIVRKGNVQTPKRLKPVIELVGKLIKKNWACNYRGIRGFTCPSKLKKKKWAKQTSLNSSVILEIMSETSHSQHDKLLTQAVSHISAGSDSTLVAKHIASARKEGKLKPKFAKFTCEYHEIYRYVRKVTRTVIPHAFWGCQRNFNIVMKSVERFIKGRRGETVTLHSVLQGFSTQECDWLLPRNPRALNQRPVVSDALKRRELIEEFLYWYFDSFIISLLRTSFYATDSAAFRQRVLYFRLDDWTKLCQPLVDQLTHGTFERLDPSEAEDVLKHKKLGFSFVRLLPKETGVRPIVNLRRKPASKMPDGSPTLSINQILRAAFQILAYEKNKQPHLLGASVLGRSQIYAKLKSFKVRLLEKYGQIPKLYFVKVDVRACFDSIEQNKLLEILQDLLTEEDGYMIHRSSVLLPVTGKIQRRFLKRAEPDDEHPSFLTYATKLAAMLRHAIFVDQVSYPHHEREDILELLKEHVTENIVKIGQDYYRQTLGIPQGSILSTILCSYFYGDLERKIYKFTEDQDSALLRLIDDYLFVTSDLSKAKRFLNMMNKGLGHPEYGCFISGEKTLTNFDANECVMNCTAPGQREFPWCGLLINMYDLSVSGDYTRYYGDIADSLTVDRGRHPGAAFEHRVLQMARIRSHAIFWDNKLNSTYVTHRNIYHNFLVSAMKICAYLRDWKIELTKSKTQSFILGVIRKMIRYTYKAIRSHSEGKLANEYGAVCSVKEISVIWLGAQAFWSVFRRKTQPGFIALRNIFENDLNQSKYFRIRQQWGRMLKESTEIIDQVYF